MNLTGVSTNFLNKNYKNVCHCYICSFSLSDSVHICRCIVPSDILESGFDTFLLINRDAHISAITFHPTRHMAVTSSFGGDFKVFLDTLFRYFFWMLRNFSGDTFVFLALFQIWVCREETQQKDQTHRNFSWMCHAVGSYKYKSYFNCYI